MEYGVNVSDGVTVAAILSGAEVTVGVNVEVGSISNVAEGTFCNSASAVCAADVLASSAFDAGMEGIAQARLAANIIANAKYVR